MRDPWVLSRSPNIPCVSVRVGEQAHCPPGGAASRAIVTARLHLRLHLVREFNQRSAAFASEFRHRLLPTWRW